MAFCIQCGTQNETEGIFARHAVKCSTMHPTPPPRAGTVRRKWLIITSVLFGLAILIVALLIPKSEKISPTVEVARGSPSSTDLLDAPVLTIVASDRRGIAMSQGSGFIITSDGLAGTNYHVIKGAAQAVAQCCNGRVFEIRSIEGADLERDLVLFQLYEQGSSQKPQNLPHVTLGSSKDVTVGQKVIAIGSPQGLENTVSDGILSAVRDYKSIRYLQITAPISPGSSGGPVTRAGRWWESLHSNSKKDKTSILQWMLGSSSTYQHSAFHCLLFNLLWAAPARDPPCCRFRIDSKRFSR